MSTTTSPPAATQNQASFNTAYIWTISLIAALGGLLFGYDWIVISGTDLFYEAHFHLTSSLQVGWAKSSALLGCLLGALVAGALSDRFCRADLHPEFVREVRFATASARV